MNPAKRVDALKDLIFKSIEELRTIKAAHPDFRVGVRNEPGSILNAYREGDVSFDQAKEMIEAKRSDEASLADNEILFLVPHRFNPDLQMMAIWTSALERGELQNISGPHLLAALEWFCSYARARIGDRYAGTS